MSKYNFGWYLIGTIFTLLSMYGYWSLWPYQILETSDVKLVDTQVLQGDSVYYSLDFCISRDTAPFLTRRWIEDGTSISLPDRERAEAIQIKRGCYDDFLVEIEIDKSIPPGKYSYKEINYFHANPIRTVEYTIITPQFEILPNEDAISN